MFRNTSYNPASRAAAAAILPSRSVGGYYSTLLPESATALQYALGQRSLPGCPPATIASNMSDAALKQCWVAFKQDLAASGQEFQDKKAKPLRATFPAAGYLNEGDWFEAEWQSVFWGDENYRRLLAIKQAVDPSGVFWCHHCVGSELWSDDGTCLLAAGGGLDPVE